MNQKKCHACGKWTDGSLSHCVFCNSLIDPEQIAKEERMKRMQREKLAKLEKETFFQKKLRLLSESEKPFDKVLYKVFNAAFMIYMAIVSFFIWLIALISG